VGAVCESYGASCSCGDRAAADVRSDLDGDVRELRRDLESLRADYAGAAAELGRIRGEVRALIGGVYRALESIGGDAGR
jgi:hypothetical protein